MIEMGVFCLGDCEKKGILSSKKVYFLSKNRKMRYFVIVKNISCVKSGHFVM